MTQVKQNKYFKLGDIIAIPLFLMEVSIIERVKKAELEVKGGRFAFARVMDMRYKNGSGITIEVFDLIGPLDTPLEEILAAKRLFRPTTTTTLQFRKRRWKVIGSTPDYDRETHSKYSELELVVGARTDPVLIRGGEKIRITKTEALQYEPMVDHQPSAIERRILVARGELEEKEHEPWLHPNRHK